MKAKMQVVLRSVSSAVIGSEGDLVEISIDLMLYKDQIGDSLEKLYGLMGQGVMVEIDNGVSNEQ